MRTEDDGGMAGPDWFSLWLRLAIGLTPLGVVVVVTVLLRIMDDSCMSLDVLELNKYLMKILLD